jgi:HEAT repeat protein
LIEASKDASPELRSKIFLTLAAIGPAAAPATATLVDGLGSDDKAVRESALYALREIGPAARLATRRLIRKMEADQSFESLAAAWALARIAGEDTTTAARIVRALKRGLSSSDEQTRLNSVDAMGELGPAAAESQKELKKLSRDDSSPAVRAAAVAAVKRVGRSS